MVRFCWTFMRDSVHIRAAFATLPRFMPQSHPVRGLGASATLLLLLGTMLSAEAQDSDGDGLADSVETNTGFYISPENTGTNPNDIDLTFTPKTTKIIYYAGSCRR